MPPHIWAAFQPWLNEAETVDFTDGGQLLLQPRLLDWIQENSAAGWEKCFDRFYGLNYI